MKGIKVKNHLQKAFLISSVLREDELKLGGHGCVSLVEKPLKIYALQLSHNILYARLSFGVSRSEDGAAILIGEDGGIKGEVFS